MSQNPSTITGIPLSLLIIRRYDVFWVRVVSCLLVTHRYLECSAQVCIPVCKYERGLGGCRGYGQHKISARNLHLCHCVMDLADISMHHYSKQWPYW